MCDSKTKNTFSGWLKRFVQGNQSVCVLFIDSAHMSPNHDILKKCLWCFGAIWYFFPLFIVLKTLNQKIISEQNIKF